MTPPTRSPVELPALIARTEALLRAHVPLSLLLDLVAADGPRSHALYSAEPADDAWLRTR